MRNFYLAAFVVLLLSTIVLAQETTTTAATTTVATTTAATTTVATTVATTTVATTTVATTTTAPATTTAATTTTATTVPPTTTTAGATTTITETTVPGTTTSVPGTTTTIPTNTTVVTTTSPSPTTYVTTTIQPPTTCPSISPPSCTSPNYLQKRFDNNGCVTGYDCVSAQKTCPSSPSPPSCPSNTRLDVRIDNNGCVTGYDCVTGTVQPPAEEKCPPEREPVCGTDKNTYYNACDARRANVPIAYKGECGREQKPFCGDNKCDIGEDQGNCPHDCGKPIPQGCRVEKDPNGFEKFFCEGDFKPVCRDIREDTDRCYSAQGKPIKDVDPAGCTIVKCEFGQQKPANPIFASAQCSTDEDVRQIEKKCASAGLPLQFVYVGEGCKQARCGQVEERPSCKEISFEERRGIEESCYAKGGQPVKDFDQNGCQLLRCGDAAACQRDVPKNAYGKCQSEGGELVVNRDDRGCVQFVDCIRRGDETGIFVEKIERVPDVTELLDIAFKLEQLRIAMDKLVKQTEDIASYYKSTSSDEEERFKRVADMFEAARDKVSEIKKDLQSKLKDITVDDVMQIKHDVRYIKDVMLKDIVYYMLSTGDEIKELKASAKAATKKEGIKDCGTNGGCFDRAFRVCKPVTFNPEGEEGPVIELRGLEGDKCIMHVELPEDQGPPAGFLPGINPPYEMTCKIKDYARGMRGPEDLNFEQDCTGSMVALITQFGTGPPERGPSGPSTRPSRPPGVEDLCSGEECAFVCPQSPENAKRCLDELGPYLQPDQKSGLERIASGSIAQRSSRSTVQSTRSSGGGGGFGSQERGFPPSGQEQFGPPPGGQGGFPPPPSGGFSQQPPPPGPSGSSGGFRP